MIGIIDYGAGNLLSVKKALDYLNADSRVVHTQNDLVEIDRIILPGVGAFQSAIEKLKSSRMYSFINKWLVSNKPFLGICLGMQVLFEGSEESEGVHGLGIFKGKVMRFKDYKVPQIGWNQVKIVRGSKIMDGIEDKSFFYFLHAYYVKSHRDDLVVGATEYGLEYVSVIEEENICAVQFHPEKSGTVGLKLLKNWIEIC
jgi:glutamine amidotransferase